MPNTIRTYSSSTLLVLAAADRGYEPKPLNHITLDQYRPFGERNDVLADFLHSEIRDVTSLIRNKVMPVDEAIETARSALDLAADELWNVVIALEILENVQPDAGLEKILECINDSYYGGEMNIDQEMEQGERGDTLADFLSHSATSNCLSEPTAGDVRKVINEINKAVSRVSGCYREIGLIPVPAPVAAARPTH